MAKANQAARSTDMTVLDHQYRRRHGRLSLTDRIQRWR